MRRTAETARREPPVRRRGSRGITSTLAGLLLITALSGIGGTPVAAQTQTPQQDKPTVSGYLQQGYEIVQIESVSTQFFYFFLQKESTLVWCSVLLQTGETSSCRTIK